MSIEQAGPAVSPKTSTSQDNRAIKGKAGDANDVPEGGFLSLLSAVSPAVELPAAEPGVSRQLPVNDQELKVDESLLVPVPQISLVDLSSPNKTGVGTLASEGLVSAAESTLTAGNLGAQGLDPRTPKLLRAGSSQGDEIQPNLTNAPSVPTDLTLGEGNAAQLAVGMGVDPRAQKLVQARRTLGDDVRAEATHARLESRAVQAASELDFVGKETMLTKLPSTGDFAARLLEPIERTRGKSFLSAGISGAEAGWTQYAHHARPVGDLPSNLSAMVTTQTQTQVADKVSYWVTQGIQNAELKLDGFGAEPVEVSILLKGGEAHVGFRSDQPEVRQMLEGAMSQLKDALEREGVLLSGVTVGGSGANGSGRQQEQRQGSNSTRDGAGGVPTASEPRILRASTSVGRSLDIFV